MSWSCSMNGFPSLSNYEEARKHFDSVKPWDSIYNPANERPIGSRSVKLDHNGRRFNKAMRERDGSIIFRLYGKDCVEWHPNNTLTVRGHATMSTTSFIGALVPWGVSHQIGRKDWDEPVLQLRAETKPNRDDLPWEQERPLWQAYWASGLIIRADHVRLHYNAEADRWEPIDWGELRPFSVPRVDRKAARDVSKRYNLAVLGRVLDAVAALSPSAGYRPQRTAGAAPMADIMAYLERGEYMSAVDLFPRGQVEHCFTRRTIGTPNSIQPGFLRQLRDHIYNVEGVVEHRDEVTLTPAAYRKYVTNSKRFY
jgi:hypothetical protein